MYGGRRYFRVEQMCFEVSGDIVEYTQRLVLVYVLVDFELQQKAKLLYLWMLVYECIKPMTLGITGFLDFVHRPVIEVSSF
jgi:hypothetical protein